MKCRIMLHFIKVFTVCQSIYLGVCFLQKDHKNYFFRERSGSVVECWTQDREAAGSSLAGVTALCP